MNKEKEKLRKKIRASLADCSPLLLDCESMEIAERMIFSPEFKNAKTIMAFLSMPGEVNTSYIIKHAFAAGKRVLVPKVNWKKQTMKAVELKSLDHPLETVKLGLKEPLDAETVKVGEIDLIIVPGLAFDEKLNRLGRGGGFYDRYLSKENCKAVKCGIAFELQVTTNIPTTENDRSIDLLVTENRIIR